MRLLEIWTPIFLAVYLLWSFTGQKRPVPIQLLPVLTLVVIALHGVTEGPRWQMVPLYAFAGVTFLLSLPSYFRSPPKEKLKKRPLRVSLSLCLLALSTLLPVLLPVPYIPDPGGPYQVGTRIYELTDASRKELYSGRDEARRFIIQIWYPAEVTSTDEHAPWMDHAEIFAPAIATYIHMPSFFLDHLALVKIPAYKDSKVARINEGFPILLFSHGWNGFNAQNTGQALELASRGYVVVGVQHTYGAVVTVFEDGTVALNNPSALPMGAQENEYDNAAHELAEQWSRDMGFALDFLEEQDGGMESLFHNSLDLSRVGVYGHSLGGGAAIQFCGTDLRCKALLGMDPYMRPVAYEILEKGLSQPSLFMFSQSWNDRRDSENNLLFDPFYSSSKGADGAFYIEGSAHYDFSDLPLLSPLAPALGLKGSINGKRVTRIVNDYLLSFFDMALKRGTSVLFNNPSPYPEVKNKQ